MNNKQISGLSLYNLYNFHMNDMRECFTALMLLFCIFVFAILLCDLHVMIGIQMRSVKELHRCLDAIKFSASLQ